MLGDDIFLQESPAYLILNRSFNRENDNKHPLRNTHIYSSMDTTAAASSAGEETNWRDECVQPQKDTRVQTLVSSSSVPLQGNSLLIIASRMSLPPKDTNLKIIT